MYLHSSVNTDVIGQRATTDHDFVTCVAGVVDMVSTGTSNRRYDLSGVIYYVPDHFAAGRVIHGFK